MRTSSSQCDRTKRPRRGTSLIEVVVMIGIATVMLGLAVTTIHLLLRAERQATRSVWHNRAVSRLSRALRDDVHAARTAVIEPAADAVPITLELTLNGDRQIHYRAAEHEITRQETAGGEDERRESFYLPPGSTFAWEREAGTPDIVRLVIGRAPLASREKPKTRTPPVITLARRRLTIEAVLGRDQRFSGAE